MAIQAVRLADAENILNLVLDAASLNLPTAIGVMQADGVHARVVGRKMGEIKVDYPEAVGPGDFVIVRDRADW
ncbi:MAG: hypothetical protein WC851_01555 [Candidatus Shapirobacteria bacterium]|jgi:hypothetical protein